MELEKNTSINKQELDKFTKSFDQWQDKEGEFRILHKINPLRLELILSTINKYLFDSKKDLNNQKKKLKIIDVGVGGGLVSIALAKLGFSISCLDANKQNIDNINNFLESNKLPINPFNETVEKFVERKEKFDLVLALEVIEHVDNQKKFLNDLHKLLNPNGILIVSTINRNIKSYMFAILVAEYVLNWLSKNTHDYKKFLKPSELCNMIDKKNLDLIDLVGMEFKNGEWKITKNIDVNYFAIFKNN